MAASGVGAIGGGLYLASRESVLGLGRVILVDTMTFGLSLLGFSATNDVCLAAPLLALAGGGFHRPDRLHQHHHPDDRGRTLPAAA